MSTSPRRRTPVRLLSSTAVLSLTAAGLTSGMVPATAAVAVERPDRNFSVHAQSLPVLVQPMNEQGDHFDYTYGAYSFGYAQHTQDTTGNKPQSQWSSNVSHSVTGDLAMPSEAVAATGDHAPNDNPGASTATGVPGTSTSGVLSVGDSSASSEANIPADGNCVPVGTPLFEGTSTVDDLDRVPVTYSDDTTLDLVDVEGRLSGTTSGTMFAVDGSTTRRGIEAVGTGSTGTFHALNGTVKIEILQAATARVSADGVNPGVTDVVAATIRITDAEDNMTVYDDTTGDTNVSFLDPNNPNLSLHLRLNQAWESSTADGTFANGFLSAVYGTYYRLDADNNQNTVGFLNIGQAGSEARVPVGGVDCSPQPDDDADGLNEYLESQYGTDPALADTDDDGLDDREEVVVQGTDPHDPDSDDDTLTDGDEVNVHSSNPWSSDSDGDGLPDGDEVNVHNTDPASSDTDGDGLNDGDEIAQDTDPLVADTDEDGLSDGTEVNNYGSNPLVADTDGGGTNDGDEASAGTDPNDELDDYRLQDADQDGLTGAEEDDLGTNPLVADTDEDGLDDGAEVNSFGTDPLLADTDEDNLDDGDEIAHSTDPLLADTDDDGLDDGDEVNDTDTDPLVADTDEDGLDDGDEVNETTTDPLVADTDGDTLSDGAEVNDYDTNPLLADTDGDTLSDSAEVNDTGTDPLVSDTDEDGLSDGVEVNDTTTNPLLADTDGDTLSDGAEVALGTDPLVADTDVDGLDDGRESTLGTDPLVADTDGGSVNDGVEVDRGSDPLDASDDLPVVVDPNKDSDGDGLTDRREARLGTNPHDKDSDDDRLRDGVEVIKLHTNPLRKDTDGDTLRDYREVRLLHTNPNLRDTDGDNLRDGKEVKGFVNTKFNKVFRSNPLKVDSDNDGLRDRIEVTGTRNGKFGYEPTGPRNLDTDGGGVRDLREIRLGSNPADITSGPRNP